MSKKTIKLACIQLTSGPIITENIAKVEKLVAEAAAAGVSFVATPENTFLMESNEKSGIFYEEDTHPAIKAASDMARRHKIWLLIGSIAVYGGNSKNYNRSYLFNPEGEKIASYDKIHLFDVEVGDGQVYRESSRIIGGNKAIIAELPWGNLGMSVCYDLRFPQLYRSLTKAGATMLSIPAAFTQVTGEAHWHILVRARAIENGCFVIAPAQTGTHAGGRQTYGHSLIIDPWGKVLADGGTEAGVVFAELDLTEVEKARSRLPSLQHDREILLKKYNNSSD